MPDHDHDHSGHDHGHADTHHSHGQGAHVHAPAQFGAAFALGAGLNATFVVVEVVVGLHAHSLALIGDAGHNGGDVLGLLAAWIASVAANRGPTRRYTYGYGRGTILAALVNAALLLISVGAITVEAVRRLAHPEAAASSAIAITAAIGIAVNGATALMFAAGRARDVNRRGAFTHMAADAAVSLGVVVAAGAIALTGWQRIDPAVSLMLAAVIAWSARGLLVESVALSLDAVPAGIDASAVRAYLGSLPGVIGLHDLHIWPISATRSALTCHLVTDHLLDFGFIGRTCAALQERFGIGHSTLQLEREGESCALAPEQVV